MKKEFKPWIMLAIFQLTLILMLCSVEKQEPIYPIQIESTEDNIRWKQEETHEEHTETHVEALDIEVVQESCETKFYDVPLSEELQLHIFKECEKRNIAPAIIIAMIEQESSYKTNSIGDKGNSLGLMQIQPKWHKGTMDKLGCSNLLDPFQNVTVGIELVAGLKEKNSDLYWVLMAYNGGQAYANRRIKSGDISDYAFEVVERAAELQREVEDEDI